MRAVVIAMLLLLAPALARAEDIAAYQVDGDSDAGGADARTAALDEAFGRAVAQALVELVDTATRKANKATLDKEIVARARLWVAGFKVDKEDLIDGRKQLAVTVRVDRDKMRARLEQLSIGGGAGTPEATAAGARTGVILMRVAETGGIRTSFGAGAEKEVPGLGALSSALRSSGITLKRASAGGTSARSSGELPLEDEDAEAIATDSKAELAVLAGVSVSAPVSVRGVATPASLITAHVRVIGKKKLVGAGVASVASRGSDASAITAAIERAIVAAAGDAMPAAPAAVAPATGFTGDDTPVAEPGVVLIRLPAKTPYALVAAELKYLSGAKGITRAALHRVSPGGWVIGVTTSESVQKIASIAKKAPATDTAVQVKVVGEIVELTMSGGM